MSKSTHTDDVTEEIVLKIVNRTETTVVLLWIDFDGNEVEYAKVPSGASYTQGSYNTHLWRIRTAEGEIHSEYQGPTACLKLFAAGIVEKGLFKDEPDPPHPEWGNYSKRGEALGLPIMAYDCVSAASVRIAEVLVLRMLELAPPQVLHNLRRFNSSVAIIGRNQVTTDIPAHAFMKHTKTGRDIDKTTRGLGGTRAVPVTSCGEENLLMQDDTHYPSENILVHEFAHAVMNIGLDHQERKIIDSLYEQARKSGQYDLGCYMMENADEYWAEGAQAWFDATIRTDVNTGVCSRELVKDRDPGLAAMLGEVYGDGPWRYPQDAPSNFRNKPRKSPRGRDPESAPGDPALSLSMDRDGSSPQGAPLHELGWEACLGGCLAGPWLSLCNPFPRGRSRTAAMLHAD